MNISSVIRNCPLLVACLIFSLILPTEFSFNLGPLRLSPYRVVLLIAFIPCLLNLISGKNCKIYFVDFLMLAHLAWSFVSIFYHHGFDVALEGGGIQIIELGGGYLVARTQVTSQKRFIATIYFVILTIFFLAPFTIFETITGIHFIKDFAASITGTGFYSGIDTRFGLHRSYGPFDHPIILGVFAASMIGVCLYLPKKSYLKLGVVIVTAISSVSSGAIVMIMTQFSIAAWEKVTRRVRKRWSLLMTILTIIYFIVDLFSTRTAMKVFLSYLTFSTHTAMYRILIFEHGIQEVWRNPFFGIGYNDWQRPEWMVASIDNFWLIQAMHFGIPSFLFLAPVPFFIAFLNWKSFPKELKTLRLGWTISLVGIVVAACTVHFWNAVYVYFGFFIGAGAWFNFVKQSKSSKPVDNANTVS